MGNLTSQEIKTQFKLSRCFPRSNSLFSSSRSSPPSRVLPLSPNPSSVPAPSSVLSPSSRRKRDLPRRPPLPRRPLLQRRLLSRSSLSRMLPRTMSFPSLPPRRPPSSPSTNVNATSTNFSSYGDL